MEKFIICLFLFSSLAIAIHGAACPGCPEGMLHEELQTEKIHQYVKNGVGKIYQKKVAENSLPDCVELEDELHSGTKQIVAGVKYALKVRVNPILSKRAECAGSNADPSSVPSEICEIIIWEKPYGNLPEDERTEISFVCPAPDK